MFQWRAKKNGGWGGDEVKENNCQGAANKSL